MGKVPSSAPTPPQGRILGLLLERERAGALPPTLREIAGDLGWRAPGTARDHVRSLVRKGYVSRTRLARDLRLTDSGRAAADRPTEQSPPAAPRPVSSKTKEIFTLFAPYFRPRRFPPGAVLWRAGDPASMVVSIETGRVRTYRMLPDGNIAVLCQLAPGDLFGILPFLDGRPYPATAEAVGEVRARTMSREAFLRALREKPEAAMPLFAFLARRLRDAFDRIELLSARGAVPRVAAALAALMPQGSGGRTMVLSLPMASGEFARALGIAPESFSRAVTDLAEANVIHRLGRGRFQVLDAQSLRAAGSPTEL